MNVPGEIRDLCADLLEGLEAALGDKLYGVYVYGAVAFPEGGATGDLDLHVILSGGLVEGEKAALDVLHDRLARDHPPLGVDLDAYYLLLEEARRTSPPRHQLLPGIVDKSWALHRAHILAGRCIVLHGPDPKQVYPPATWPELAHALRGEWDYVAQHLAEYPAYCVLNLCRLIYSFETRDVVISKRASAVWGAEAFPAWRSLIAAAVKWYDGRATPQDEALLKADVRRFFGFAQERIREDLDETGTMEKGA
jgi:hypothetical protein